MEGLQKLLRSIDDRITQLEKQIGFLIDRYRELEHVVEKNRLDVKQLGNKGE